MHCSSAWFTIKIVLHAKYNMFRHILRVFFSEIVLGNVKREAGGSGGEVAAAEK